MFKFWRFTPFALVMALAVGSIAISFAQDSGIQLPPDTQALIRLNFRAMIDSPLAKKMGIEKASEIIKSVPGGEILAEMGFDPLKDIDSITIAAPGGGDMEKGLIIVAGKFKSEKLVAKANEEAKNNKDKVKTHKAGEKTIFEVIIPEQQVPMFMMIASNSTILASTQKDYLEKALANSGSKLSNKDFSALVEKLDPKLAISMVAVSSAFPSKSLPEPAKAIIEGIDSIGGGIGVDKDITLSVNVFTKDEESSKKLKETMDQGMAQALGFLGLMAAQQKELTPVLEFVKSMKTSSKAKMMSLEGKLPGKMIEDAILGSK
ncbi:MAG: hypothetical protein EBT92_04230 [Planctomycetes bacterium]|nr:hypothetical protein [Planctomycetota bacterium]NBY01892.1 hypothetical protein [Planctomycetota bacterium]